MSDKLQKFMQLTKVDLAKKRITGVFTAEVVDKSGEVADYPTTKAAIMAWSEEIQQASKGKSKGNIRKMHGKEVVGKAVEIVCDDVNKMILGTVEVDDHTLDQADKGILNGFSIGGSYAKKWADPVHKGKIRFTPVIAEISVVDNPCVPDAVFDAIKDASFAVVMADGSTEMRKFAPRPESEPELPLAKVKTVFQAEDGSTHETPEAALQKNTEIQAARTAAPVLAALEKVGKAGTDCAADDMGGDMKDEGKAKDKKKKGKVKVKKGMGSVARLASLIESLDWLRQDMEWEEEYEGDNSKNPKYIKQCIGDLVEVLKDLVVEETDEMTMEQGAGLSDAAVAFMRKALGNADLLKDFKPAPAAAHPDTAALAALQKVFADLPAQIEKKFTAMSAEAADLKKRVKELEAQPAPDNIRLSTVVKGEGMETHEKDPAPDPAPISLNGMSPNDIRSVINR